MLPDEKATRTPDQAAQEARARQLRTRVQEVLEEAKGAAKPEGNPAAAPSPREFIHRKMGEVPPAQK